MEFFAALSTRQQYADPNARDGHEERDTVEQCDRALSQASAYLVFVGGSAQIVLGRGQALVVASPAQRAW